MVSFDISKAPERLKNLLCLVVILPFWYITVHLFHPEFFLRADLFLISAYCIIFTLISFIIFGDFAVVQSRTKAKENNLPSEDISVFSLDEIIISILYQALYHCFLLLILLILENIFEVKFFYKTYLGFYFFLPSITFTINLFSNVFSNIKKQKLS